MIMVFDSDSEVYADYLSQIVNDVDFAEVDSECESDNEFFHPSKPRVSPLVNKTT